MMKSLLLALLSISILHPSAFVLSGHAQTTNEVTTVETTTNTTPRQSIVTNAWTELSITTTRTTTRTIERTVTNCPPAVTNVPPVVTNGITLTVTAVGRPHFLVRVKGVQVGSVTITTASSNLFFVGNWQPTDKIEVQFDNDASGIDLFITSLKVNGAALDLSKATHLPAAQWGGWESGNGRFALYQNDTMTVNGTPPPTTLITPAPPFNLRASATGPGSIDVQWSDTNTMPRVASLEMRLSPGGVWSEIASTTADAYTVTGLAPSTTYDFRARIVTP